MEIKRVITAEFTKKEEETIDDFLKIKNAFFNNGDCKAHYNCKNCPFYRLCDLDIDSVHDFQKAITAMFQ